MGGLQLSADSEQGPFEDGTRQQGRRAKSCKIVGGACSAVDSRSALERVGRLLSALHLTTIDVARTNRFSRTLLNPQKWHKIPE